MHEKWHHFHFIKVPHDIYIILIGEIRVKSIDPEDVIERIFSPTGSGVLPESIPLPQMVDILIDFWEADGLFD